MHRCGSEKAFVMTVPSKAVSHLRAVQITHYAEQAVLTSLGLIKLFLLLIKNARSSAGFEILGEVFADYSMVQAGWDCTSFDLRRSTASCMKTIQCNLHEEFSGAASFDVVTAAEIQNMRLRRRHFSKCRRVEAQRVLVLTTQNVPF
jgi:hypothetical protein